MNTRPSPRPSGTPPAARPKSSSSSITSSHAASSSQQPPAMVSGSRPGMASTPTTSRSSIKPAESEKPARPSSRDSLKQKMLKKPEEAPKPNKTDEVGLPRNATEHAAGMLTLQQQLRALRSDFDSLRSHITCKICDRILYQPYTISCGHTYCYTVSDSNECLFQASL